MHSDRNKKRLHIQRKKEEEEKNYTVFGDPPSSEVVQRWAIVCDKWMTNFAFMPS